MASKYVSNHNENSILNQEMTRMKTERDGLVTDARQMISGINKLNQDFGAAVDYGSTYEEMTRLLEKFEKNSAEHFNTLDELHSDIVKSRVQHADLNEAMAIEEPPVVSSPREMEHIMKDKKGASHEKLNTIFFKIKKQHNDMIHTIANDIDQDIGGGNGCDSESALVPILQRKCTQLKKEVDDAESKARSITAQWNADKKLHDEAMAKMQNDMVILKHKNQLNESKARAAEQQARDGSQASTVSRIEFEELQRDYKALQEKLEETESDSASRLQKLHQAESDLLAVQAELQEMERVRAKMLQKQADMDRKNAHHSDRVTQVQEEMEDMMRLQEAEYLSQLREASMHTEKLHAELQGKLVQIDELVQTRMQMERNSQALEHEVQKLKAALEQAQEQIQESTHLVELQTESLRKEASTAHLLCQVAEGRSADLEALLRRAAEHVRVAFAAEQKAMQDLKEVAMNSVDNQAARSAAMLNNIKALQAHLKEQESEKPKVITEFITVPVIKEVEVAPPQKETVDAYVQVEIDVVNSEYDSRPEERRESFDDTREDEDEDDSSSLPRKMHYANLSSPVSEKHLLSEDLVVKDGQDQVIFESASTQTEDELFESFLLSLKPVPVIEPLIIDVVAEALPLGPPSPLRMPHIITRSVSEYTKEEVTVDKFVDNIIIQEKHVPCESTECQTDISQDFFDDVEKKLKDYEQAIEESDSRFKMTEQKLTTVERQSSGSDLKLKIMERQLEEFEKNLENSDYMLTVAEQKLKESEQNFKEAQQKLAQEYDAKLEEQAQINSTLEGDIALMRAEVTFLEEASKDWNSRSKWEKLVSTQEGKDFLESTLDQCIKDAISYITYDEEISGLSEAEVEERMERAQIRQAMLLKLKGIQALQSLLPADFVNIDQRFMGIKYEYPPELLEFLRSKYMTGVQPTTASSIPSSMLSKLKEDKADLIKLGDVRRENFERLKGKGFGIDSIVDLTVLEYYVNDMVGEHGPAKSTAMQYRALCMERDILKKKVSTEVPIEDLYAALKAAENHFTQMQSLNAWRRLLNFISGDQFSDILSMHITCLRACIESVGGTKVAMERVIQRNNMEEDTSIWPERFRAKVLEYYRSELLKQTAAQEEEVSELKMEIDDLTDQLNDTGSQAEVNPGRANILKNRPESPGLSGVNDQLMYKQKSLPILSSEKQYSTLKAGSKDVKLDNDDLNSLPSQPSVNSLPSQPSVISLASQPSVTESVTGSKATVPTGESTRNNPLVTKAMRPPNGRKASVTDPAPSGRKGSVVVPVANGRKAPVREPVATVHIPKAYPSVSPSLNTTLQSLLLEAPESPTGAAGIPVSSGADASAKLKASRYSPGPVDLDEQPLQARQLPLADRSRSNHSNSRGGLKSSPSRRELQKNSELVRLSLHRPADRITLGVFQGDARRIQLAETLVVFLGHWNDGHYETAINSRNELEKQCGNEDEKKFIQLLGHVFDELKHGTVPLEVTEIFAKLNDALELQAYFETQALLNVEKNRNVLPIVTNGSYEPGPGDYNIHPKKFSSAEQQYVANVISTTTALRQDAAGCIFTDVVNSIATNSKLKVDVAQTTLEKATSSIAASAALQIVVKDVASLIAMNSRLKINVTGQVVMEVAESIATSSGLTTDVTVYLVREAIKSMETCPSLCKDVADAVVRQLINSMASSTTSQNEIPDTQVDASLQVNITELVIRDVISSITANNSLQIDVADTVMRDVISSIATKATFRIDVVQTVDRGDTVLSATDGAVLEKDQGSGNTSSQVQVENKTDTRSAKKAHKSEVQAVSGKKNTSENYSRTKHGVSASSRNEEGKEENGLVVPAISFEKNIKDWIKKVSERQKSRMDREKIFGLKQTEMESSKPSLRVADSVEAGTQTGFAGNFSDNVSDVARHANAISSVEVITVTGNSSGRQSQVFAEVSQIAHPTFQLLPPFKLASITGSGELELCPGVFLCTRYSLPPPPSPVLPKGVWFVRKDEGAKFLNGIEPAPTLERSLPGPLPSPLPFNLIPVFLPPMMPLCPGISLVPGADFGPLLDLPQSVVVIKVEDGVELLPNMLKVELSGILAIPPTYDLPPGHSLVQATSEVVEQSPTPLVLGTGVSLGPSIEVVQPPGDGVVTLPPGVMMVKNLENRELPRQLQLIPHANDLEDILTERAYMTTCCTVLRRPPEVDLGLGMELIHRPPGVPLPPGMSIVPYSHLPEGLVLPANIEAVQLTPRFELQYGLVIGPGVTVYPRLPFMKLPANVFLVNREMGAPLPQGFRTFPMPTLPYGYHALPSTVEAVEMLPGAHLQAGVELAPGLVVTEIPAAIKLPFGMELVKRQPWAVCPPGVERALRNELPSKMKLPHGLEIVRLVPRFELPVGVQLGPGATLGKNVQLTPGLILDFNLEVVQWPQGVFFPPHVDLVRLPGDKSKEVPLPFRRFDFDIPKGIHLPSGCAVVKLPPVLHLPTARQIAECFELVEPPADLDLTYIPPGIAFIKRRLDRNYGCLPLGMTLASKADIPRGLEIPRFAIAVRIAPRMEIPVGVELARGVEVVSHPYGLYIPPNLTLVKVEPGTALPPGIELCPFNLPSKQPPLPANVLAVTVASDFCFASWGRLQVGRVIEIKRLVLPPGAQVVERRGSGALPAGLRVADASELTPGTPIPPGATVIMLPQRYYLPQCIGTDTVTIRTMPPTVWLGPGDRLCAGVQIASRPQGMTLPTGVEVVYREPHSVFSAGIDSVDYQTILALHASSPYSFPPLPAGYQFVHICGPLPPIKDRLSKTGPSGSLTDEVSGGPLRINLLLRPLATVIAEANDRKGDVDDDEEDSVISADSSSFTKAMGIRRPKGLKVLERRIAVLQRDNDELTDKVDKQKGIIGEANKRAALAEEAVKNLETNLSITTTDLEATKEKAVEKEAALRVRIVDKETEKNRLMEHIGDVKAELESTKAELKLWKTAQKEESSEVIADAVRRGRMMGNEDVITARKQVFGKCREVLFITLKALCNLIAGALAHDYNTEREEYRARYSRILKHHELTGGGDGAWKASSERKLSSSNPSASVQSTAASSESKQSGRNVASRARKGASAADDVGQHKRSQEVSLDVLTPPVIDPNLYTVNQMNRFKDLSHFPTAGNPKPMSAKKKKVENEFPWEPLVVHMAQLRDVPVPAFDAEKELLLLNSKVGDVFSFGDSKGKDAALGELAIDEDLTKNILSEWVGIYGGALNSYVSALLARHLDVLRLAEVELHAQVNQRNDALFKLQLLSDKMAEINELSGAYSGFDAVQEKTRLLKARVEEYRLGSEKSTLDMLKEQVSRMQDFSELHGRLSLCALSYRKQAQEEDERRMKLRRSPTDPDSSDIDAETKASLHLSKRLNRQAEVFEDRAEVAQGEATQLKLCIQSELEDFGCSVQATLPPQALAQLLRYSQSRRQSATIVTSCVGGGLIDDSSSMSLGLSQTRTVHRGREGSLSSERPLSPLSTAGSVSSSRSNPASSVGPRNKGGPLSHRGIAKLNEISMNNPALAALSAPTKNNKKQLESISPYLLSGQHVADDASSFDGLSVKSLGSTGSILAKISRKQSRGIMSSTLPSQPAPK